MGSSFTSEQDTKGKIFKRIKVKPPPPSKDFRSPPNPPNPLKRLLIPSKSPKDPQSREKTSDPLKISRRLPIPSKDFRSPQNPPTNPLKRLLIPSKSPKDPQSPQKTSDPLKISRRLPIPSKDFRSPQNPPNPAAPSPSRPRIITSRRHPLFFLFGLPTRPTTHTPHNTRSRGVENCGAPDQNRRVATGLARAYGFWVLRSSRQAGAGSRGRVTIDGSPTPHQNSLAPQNSGAPAQRRATQPRPCARADTTRPATANYPPVRKECLSRGFPSSKEPPQQFHHTTMICTSNHHSISHYLACTDRPDGRRATRHLETRKPAATAATEETP